MKLCPPDGFALEAGPVNNAKLVTIGLSIMGIPSIFLLALPLDSAISTSKCVNRLSERDKLSQAHHQISSYY